MRNISPSIIAADFTKLEKEIMIVEDLGMNRLHLDIMDGNFVPNITFGPFVVEAIRKMTNLHLECHLMINKAGHYIDEFISAGADTVIVHFENNTDVENNLIEIRKRNAKSGLAFNPDSSVENIVELLPLIDYVLIMSVFPGFCGQSFIESSLKSMDKLVYQKNKFKDLMIGVDGGVNIKTINRIFKTGIDVGIVGSGFFGAEDKNIRYQELINV